jgi:hypothetical protein
MGRDDVHHCIPDNLRDWLLGILPCFPPDLLRDFIPAFLTGFLHRLPQSGGEGGDGILPGRQAQAGGAGTLGQTAPQGWISHQPA